MRHAALSTALLMFTAPAFAATPARADATAAPATCAANPRIEGIRQAIAAQPDEAALNYFLAAAQSRCGDVAAAADTLRRLAALERGYVPTPALFDAQHLQQPPLAAQAAAMRDALPEVTEADVFARFDDPMLIPEGIAYDAAGGRLFMGSIANGEILVRGRDGAQRRFAGGLPSVLGLAVDPARNALHAVATSALRDGAPPDNRVVSFDLDDGRVQRTVEVAAAGQLNDVAVAADGTLYVSDSRAGGVWRITPAGIAEELVPKQSLHFPNGLALDGGGRRLYLAHATGVAVVDTGSGTIVQRRIANATGESLSALDGLYRHGDWLIGVQNHTQPGRVLALRLSADGGRIVEARTLLSHHHPALDVPTTGALADGRFLLLANSFVDRFGRDGRITGADSLTAPTVLAVALPDAR